MIQSLFIVSPAGEVLIEKHWRKVTSRNVVDLFLDEVNACEEPSDVLPVIATSSMYLVNVYRNKLFLLCAVVDEAPPLLVVEFLHRVFDTLQDYLTEVHDATIKENFSTVYQLLEEMCDNGFPLITEPNALKEMIAPPSIQNRLVAAVSGKSSVADVLPDGTVSSMPWRKKGVHYSVNSIYFDIIEEIDCIIGRNGMVVSCEVSGRLECKSNLSGMPDVLLTFKDPWVFKDFSLHPSIRVARFEQERVLSFVPPDGSFTLMEYTVDAAQLSTTGAPPAFCAQVHSSVFGSSGAGGGAQGLGSRPTAGFSRACGGLPSPVYCQPQITYSGNEGRVEVMVGAKALGHIRGKPEFLPAEDIAVVIPFPRTIRSTDLKCNVGTVLCDETTKECRWQVGKIPKDSTPKLTGTFTFLPNSPPPDDTLTVLLEFQGADTSASGLSVADVSVFGETYEPYKYFRSTLRAGKLQIRCP